MTVSLTTDLSGLRREIGAIRSRGSAGRREAVVVMAGDFVTSALAIANSIRDTNRYVNGWAQAGNAVGAGPFPVRPLRPSKYLAQARKALLEQIRKFDQWAATERREKGKVSKRTQNLQRRSREELGKLTSTSIVFGVRGGESNRNLRVSVRDKVYGGTGQIIELNGGPNGGQTIVLLHNKEAHSTIVEHNHKVRALAGARARAFGVRSVGQKYIREATAGTGAKVA